MPILFRDIETYSTLDLTKVGAWRYAGDATTGIWCVAFAVDDGPAKIWIPGQPIPEEFHLAERDPDWRVGAHNAQFESAIEERLLAPRYGWPLVPIARHRCTMAMTLAAALPAKLEKAAEALNLSIRKDAEGARLMLQMSRPRKSRPGEDPHGIYWHDDPEKQRRLQQYCVRDVELERELYRRLPPLSEAEQLVWQLDAEINRRGFHVDVALAGAAHKIVRQRRAAIDYEIAELTGGQITTANQVAKIEAFLKERGHSVQSVGKRSVSAVLAHEPDKDVCRLLRLRQEGAKASANKLDTLLEMANDSRLHGTLRFHGAATGRWSGSGFQPHNLSRAQPADLDATIAAVRSGELERVAAIGPPIEVVASLSRAMICAAPGKVLISADYSAIESRVLAWIAGESWKLDTYRKFDATGDPALEPYCVTATRILGRQVTPENENDRQIGKLCDLAFGYGGGAGAFNRIAPDSKFTDAAIEQFKRQWRAAHPAIVRYWSQIHRVLLRAVRTHTAAAFKNLAAEMRDGNLYLRLPSGREIAYPEARIQAGQYSDEIVFKDSAIGKWRDVRGWHGTFVENVVQAISRDLLAAAMLRLEAAGYPIVLHVHDEIVAEVPEDFGSSEEFARLMVELPPWAAGLPLVAKPSRRQRYAKDKNNPEPASMGEDKHIENEAPTPVTPADIAEINAGLQREGIEPIAAHSEDAIGMRADDTIVTASSALAAAIASMTAAISNCAGTEHRASDDSDFERQDPFTGYASGEKQSGHTVETYIYRDAGGRFYHKVVRTSTKQFPQFVWINVAWRSGAPAIKIPYRLPELIKGKPDEWVFICEGEKDSNNVSALGLTATTSPGGAGKWTQELDCWFVGKQRVGICEDNDDPGRAHARQVADRLLGVVPDVRIISFAELPEHGDVSDWLEQGHGKAELLARAEAAAPYKLSSLGEWDAGDDIEPPPPREWLLGNIFCRRFVSSLYGDGGAGKTALRYTQYLSLVTGKELTGEHVFQRCRVLIVSLEDDDQELKRRIRATRLHHKIGIDEVRGWLFLSAPGNKIGKLMELDSKGRTVRSTLADILDATISKRQIDLVSLDPFVKSHAVDENMNKQIDAVMEVLTDLTAKHNIAIDIPHHTRKGAADPGNADRGRGASAQKNAGRLIYTLTPMTSEEAKAFGLEDEQRHALVRMDSGKVNIAPKLWKAAWFRLVGVQLDNASELYPHGDNVQTVEPWIPPDVWQGLDTARINRILDVIDAGLPDGNRYSDTPSAKKRAAWKVVVDEMPEKSEAQAREIIKTWVKNGLLERYEYENPATRKQVDGLRVDPAKRPSEFAP